MLGSSSRAISREEASLLIETAAKIQSGDDSGFIPASNELSSRACTDIWRMPRGSTTPLLAAGLLTDRSDWNSRGVDVWAALVEEYKEWGIEKRDNAYYYWNERVSLLYDLGTDRSVRMNYDADGDINIRLLRDDSGIISKVDYLTAGETLEILNEFHIVTAAPQDTPANTPDSGANNRKTSTALQTDI